MKTARAFGVGLGSIFDKRFSYVSLEVMRSVNGRLEVVGGLDPFAQFDPEALTSEVRPRRWSIFRAMRCRWFIFQQRCDTDYFLEKLNIAIVAIIFLDLRERLFADYFAHFRTDYFAIIQ